MGGGDLAEQTGNGCKTVRFSNDKVCRGGHDGGLLVGEGGCCGHALAGCFILGLRTLLDSGCGEGRTSCIDTFKDGDESWTELFEGVVEFKSFFQSYLRGV